jgi:transcriptional regulator
MSHSSSHRLIEKRKTRLTDLQQRKAFKLRANGLSYREIANLLGTSKDTIWRLFTNEDDKNIIAINNENDHYNTTIHEEDIKIINGKRYRLFDSEAFHRSEGALRQAYVNHYIITLAEFSKIRLGPSKWYYEIKPHRCPYHCIDSGPQDIYEQENYGNV